MSDTESSLRDWRTVAAQSGAQRLRTRPSASGVAHVTSTDKCPHQLQTARPSCKRSFVLNGNSTWLGTVSRQRYGVLNKEVCHERDHTETAAASSSRDSLTRRAMLSLTVSERAHQKENAVPEWQVFQRSKWQWDFCRDDDKQLQSDMHHAQV